MASITEKYSGIGKYFVAILIIKWMNFMAWAINISDQAYAAFMYLKIFFSINL